MRSKSCSPCASETAIWTHYMHSFLYPRLQGIFLCSCHTSKMSIWWLFCLVLVSKWCLKSMTSFLPKVVPAFHLNQNIVLLSHCLVLVHQKEMSLVWMWGRLCKSASATVFFRNTASLIVIKDGAQVLGAPDIPLFRLMSQGSGSLFLWRCALLDLWAPFWAFQHQGTVSQIFTSATWSPVHMFCQVDVAFSSDASVGFKVLQTALWATNTPQFLFAWAC